MGFDNTIDNRWRPNLDSSQRRVREEEAEALEPVKVAAGLTRDALLAHLRAHPHGTSTMRLFPDAVSMLAVLLGRRHGFRELAAAEAGNPEGLLALPLVARARSGRCGWSRR